MTLIRDTDQPVTPPIVIGLEPGSSDNTMYLTVNGIAVISINEVENGERVFLAPHPRADSAPVLRNLNGMLMHGDGLRPPPTEQEYEKRAAEIVQGEAHTSAPMFNAVITALKEGM